MSDEPLTLLESRKKDLGLDLSDSDLRELYATMVRVRKLDDKMVLLQRQGRIGFYVPCLGQEACHIGAAFALEPEDWLFPHYRDTGNPLLRGVSMQRMVNQLFGNADDDCKGRQMPNHFSFKDINFVSISSPLATQIVQAAGTAYAMRVKGDKRVAMSSFGDGCTSENDFHAGLNMAAVTKSPCVFVCENNQWAISVPLSRQSGSKTIAIKADAYGMPGVQVDGNDILAVYKAAKEAVDLARAGGGPTLIETVTYRMGPHSTSDDPSRYCPPEELEAWAKKDPIMRFEQFLLRREIVDQAFLDKTAADAETEVATAVAQAEASVALPEVDTMFDDVYEDLPPILQQQREAMRRDFNEHGMPGGH